VSLGVERLWEGSRDMLLEQFVHGCFSVVDKGLSLAAASFKHAKLLRQLGRYP
jgi:hypothetical protein